MINKKNVFVVSSRQRDAGGEPRGEIVNCVVCTTNEERLRQYMAEEQPASAIVGVVNLLMLEQQINRVKDVLAGVDTSWSVLVDVALQSQKVS